MMMMMLPSLIYSLSEAEKGALKEGVLVFFFKTWRFVYIKVLAWLHACMGFRAWSSIAVYSYTDKWERVSLTRLFFSFLFSGRVGGVSMMIDG
jgi:hypothetical protein